jgi:hypothetical protein
MSVRGRTVLTLAAVAAATTLAGCGGGRAAEAGPPASRAANVEDDRGLSLGGLFGGGDRKPATAAEIGVNSFLWRATLDTISFMPLEKADPYGGVIITEWYNNPQQPNERFKATVYILDTRLRADGVQVVLFKERLTANGWMTDATDPSTAEQIENQILTRARQLRLQTAGG